MPVRIAALYQGIFDWRGGKIALSYKKNRKLLLRALTILQQFRDTENS